MLSSFLNQGGSPELSSIPTFILSDAVFKG
jgi:hypothetical protein